MHTFIVIEKENNAVMWQTLSMYSYYKETLCTFGQNIEIDSA